MIKIADKLINLRHVTHVEMYNFSFDGKTTWYVNVHFDSGLSLPLPFLTHSIANEHFEEIWSRMVNL